jgi:hypothetical protein
MMKSLMGLGLSLALLGMTAACTSSSSSKDAAPDKAPKTFDTRSQDPENDGDPGVLLHPGVPSPNPHDIKPLGLGFTNWYPTDMKETCYLSFFAFPQFADEVLDFQADMDRAICVDDPKSPKGCQVYQALRAGDMDQLSKLPFSFRETLMTLTISPRRHQLGGGSTLKIYPLNWAFLNKNEKMARFISKTGSDDIWARDEGELICGDRSNTLNGLTIASILKWPAGLDIASERMAPPEYRGGLLTAMSWDKGEMSTKIPLTRFVDDTVTLKKLVQELSATDFEEAQPMSSMSIYAYSGNFAMMDILYQAGIPHAPRWDAALTWAVRSPEKNRLDIIQNLLDHGYDINQTAGGRVLPTFLNQFPVPPFLKDNEIIDFMHFVFDKGLMLRPGDLSLAVTQLRGESFNDELVQVLALLIDHGSDVNESDEAGVTPLQLRVGDRSSFCENDPVAIELLKRGASGDTKPLPLLSLMEKNSKNFSTCPDLTLRLLNATSTENLNHRNENGETLLFHAPGYLYSALLARGVDTSIRNKDGHTAEDVRKIIGMPNH